MNLLNATQAKRRIIRNTLALSLALSLSGALPVIRSAFAVETNPFILAQAASTRATELNEQLELLVRRARHPYSPAAPGGVPTQAEVTRTQEDVLTWRTQMEQVLTNPELAQTAQIGAVNSYLNVLTLLTTLRIALSLPHGPSWSDGLSLRIPKAIMATMPNVGAAPASNRLGDMLLPLVIDRGPNDEADPVQLKISASLLQGLELGRLADSPSSETYLTMVQYMATRQLLQNLTDLRFLKRDHNVMIPEIAAPLRTKLESMGLASVIDQEQRRAMAEPGARAALAGRYENMQEQFPAFVDAKFVTDLSNIIGTTSETRQAARAPIFDELTDAEKSDSSEKVKKELQDSPEMLSSLKTSELLIRLRLILSTAKAFTQLDKLISLKQKHVFGLLSVEQRESMMNLLNDRKKAYAESLTDTTLRAWYNEAREASESSIYEGHRDPFVETLMARAPQVVKQTQESYSGDVVDTAALARAFSKELSQMSPRDSVKDWLFEITGAGSYLASRAKFAKIMASLTCDGAVTGDAVNVGAVNYYLEHHDFKPDMVFSVDSSHALEQKLIARIVEGRIRDIRNLMEIGKWLGFNMDFPGGAPTVHEVLTTPEKVESYFQIMDHATMTDNPILSVEVTTLDASTGSESQVRLADALTALNPQNVSRQDLMDRAQPLIDQALVKIEANIRKDIDLVGHATSLDEIEKVVTSSLMLALVMKGFPEFRMEQQSFIRQVLEPSFEQQILHRYLGNATTYGFAVIMLLHVGGKITQYVAKDTAPYILILGAGVDSVLAGFMRAAMIGMAADSAYAVKEYFHSRTENEQANDFYQSSAWGRSFLDGGEIAAANSSFKMNSWMFAGRMAMDVGAMYFPMAKGLITARGDSVLLREFIEDGKAFEKLGLQPGEFKAVEGRMRTVRRAWDTKPVRPDMAIREVRSLDEMVGEGAIAGKVRTMTAEEFAEIEKAYARLSGKLVAGKTYTLPNVLEELAKEDCFKSLNLPPKASSFAKVDEAFERLKKIAFNPVKLSNLERARAFLKTYVESHPESITREFKPVTKSERRLVEALGRKGYAEQMWKSMSSNDTGGSP